MIIRDWDETYQDTPPWDIGRPQPAFEALVKDREIRPGRILDSGCGTGENALLLAQNGSMVTGIDLAGEAVAKARLKAKERHIAADFVQGNVLEIDRYFGPLLLRYGHRLRPVSCAVGRGSLCLCPPGMQSAPTGWKLFYDVLLR